MMKFSEEKYGKLCQRKNEIQHTKNVKISLLPYFLAHKYNIIDSFIVRFVHEDDMTPN